MRRIAEVFKGKERQLAVGLLVLALGAVLAAGGSSSNGLSQGLQKAINEFKAGGDTLSAGACYFINKVLPIIAYSAAIASIFIGGAIRAVAPGSRWWGAFVGGGIVAALLLAIFLPTIQSMMGGDKCRTSSIDPAPAPHALLVEGSSHTPLHELTLKS